MGAQDFFHTAEGKTAQEAFRNAQEQARYEWGHAGYTGTIAEKDSFIMLSCPDGVDPYARADQLIDGEDRRVSDKWGPAGCFHLGNNKYLFFGWASS